MRSGIKYENSSARKSSMSYAHAVTRIQSMREARPVSIMLYHDKGENGKHRTPTEPLMEAGVVVEGDKYQPSCPTHLLINFHDGT